MAKGSVNRVILVGNLGADPQTRYLPSGAPTAQASLATTETWKDRDSGERRERTEWHRVVFFGKLAEIVQQYLGKGAKVYVEGRLRTRKWQGQDGQDRYTTEVVAEGMQMLGGRQEGGQAPSQGGEDSEQSRAYRDASGASMAHQAPQDAPYDDEIPF